MIQTCGGQININITEEKRSSLTHDAEIVSPGANPPVPPDKFAEIFLAVIEEILDPDWGLRKLHQGVTHLPAKVTMVAWHVRDIEKFHLGYKIIKLMNVLREPVKNSTLGSEWLKMA